MGNLQQRNLHFLAMVSFLLMSTPPAAGRQIRLAGSGSTRCSGRVEIYHNNVWGTVCDDEWDLNDAQVVCRQLDCGTALSVPQSTHFGQGTGQIWLDDVACSGRERSLTECQHRGFGQHDCGHGEDAGVICSVSLPKPSISMNPVGEITWGQDVSITCSISTQHLGGTFILQKTLGPFRETQTSSTNTATFSISRVTFINEGSYQCQYQIQVSSRDFSSPVSDTVRLSVTVRLPKPSISMNPVGEIAWGQDVSITCSISTQVLGGTFILQKTTGLFRETQTSSTNSATFSIRQVDFNNEGLYQCQYEKSSSSRNFMSPQSDFNRLSVTVPLQQPNISLTSPNEGLVLSPEGAEITKGYSFVIACSINSRYSEGRFILTFSGSNITDTKPAVNQSASFDFPVAEYEHQGNYSCVYEVTLSSRKFTSTETAAINVIVKLSLLLLLSSVAGGILLLLVPVLLPVFLVFRRRRRAKQAEVLVQTQLSVIAENEYECSEDDNEDEEEDYMNVHPMDIKNLKEGAWMVEEESDEDHDHEDAGPNANFMKAKEISSGVRSIQGVEEEQENEEDEEEINNDEDIYENVTRPIQDEFIEIYGECEDIYQNF